MYSFNLVHKPWMPCIMSDGSQQDLGLQETLVRAHEIQEVFAESPIVTVSLYRLLLAITQRIFTPTSLSDWENRLWDKKAFSAQALTNYFEQWQDRFDLFHSEWPFYQKAKFVTKKATPIKRLGWEFSCGNNATLFDHSWDDDQAAVKPSVAARWILATQAFAASAGKSETLHTKDSPWTRGAIVLMQGKNLFETLTLNLLNFYNPNFYQTPEDKPVWETSKDWQPEHNATPIGILDYLTWQSRSIFLVPGESVKECYFAQGRALTEDKGQEPMYVYNTDEKRGLLVWQFQEDKAIWRDSHTLFNLSPKSSYKIPLAIRHIATLIGDGVLDKQHLYQVQIIGQCLESGQPTVKFWRQERLSVPSDYFNEDNKKLLEPLTQAIALAEKVEKQVWFHTQELAKLLIAPTSDQKGGRSPDPKDIKNLVSHFDAATKYWAKLETPFKSLLIKIPNDPQKDEDENITGYGENELKTWAEILRNTASESFLAITKSLDTSSRTLKAVASVEPKFNGSLKKLLKDYLPQNKATTLP